jgi:hypothetical protein
MIYLLADLPEMAGEIQMRPGEDFFHDIYQCNRYRAKACITRCRAFARQPCYRILTHKDVGSGFTSHPFEWFAFFELKAND